MSWDESFADRYDEWAAAMTDDIAFYVDLALDADGPLVEPAVGSGRVAIPVAQATGLLVVGIDSSSAMLQQARANTSSSPAVRCEADGMLRVGTVVIGVDDLPRAVAFWTQALDYVPKRTIGAEDDFTILVPATGDGTHLALDVSETPVQPEPRIHLDLHAGDTADQAAEVERLVALGAERVDWDRYPDDPDFVVLADTEGNRFCVIDTSHG